MKKIAIDLTWIRHGQVGGTESKTINLLKGLDKIRDDSICFYLVTAQDNYRYIESVLGQGYFRYLVVGTISASQMKRVLWQNFRLCRTLRRYGIDECLEPIYSIPFTNLRGVKFYADIADLQAIHFPQYFSKLRVLYMKLSWRNTVRRAYKVLTISDFVRDDIIKVFKVAPEKVKRIYCAIDVEKNYDKSDLEKNALIDYGIDEDEYYFTVSSLLPHKNLKTILLTLSKLKDKNSPAYKKIVVSGVGGALEGELKELIDNGNLYGDVILTGFIDDNKRNALYKYCRAFLFPSTFEGFGMPPVEAMLFGKEVVTTRCASIPEVTDNACNYVDDPMSVDEWAEALEKIKQTGNAEKLKEKYSPENIARQYLELLNNDKN